MALAVPVLLGHAVQAFEDTPVALNAFAAHAVTEEPSPVYPALALQSFSSSDPVAGPVPENEGQAAQRDAPVEAANVFSAHAVHDESELVPDLKWPAEQS